MPADARPVCVSAGICACIRRHPNARKPQVRHPQATGGGHRDLNSDAASAAQRPRAHAPADTSQRTHIYVPYVLHVRTYMHTQASKCPVSRKGGPDAPSSKAPFPRFQKSHDMQEFASASNALLKAWQRMHGRACPEQAHRALSPVHHAPLGHPGATRHGCSCALASKCQSACTGIQAPSAPCTQIPRRYVRQVSPPACPGAPRASNAWRTRRP